MPEPVAAAEETPWQLLRTNSVFARLWLGQVLSQAGDWLSFVALLSLLLELTGSGMSVSLLLLCTSVPSLLAAPLAGVVADRFDRRRVLVAVDLVRAGGTLGFLLLRRPGDEWMAYALTTLNVVAASFFAPALAAAIPNLVRPSQVTSANVLAGATSGVMLALGAWIGGVVSSHLGRPAAFGLDALTFLVSALLFLSVRQPFSNSPAPAGRTGRAAAHAFRLAWADVAEACRYALDHRAVLAVLLLKAGAGLGGGLLALLSVMPVQVFRAGDFGVGALYAARGLGSVLGSLLAPAFGGDPPARARAAAAGLVVSGAFGIALSSAASLAWAAAFVVLAYLGVGVVWVHSSTLLQRHVDDRVLGRVFALDNAGMTFTATLSTVLCGWGLVTVGPRAVALGAGAAVAAAGLLWLLACAWLRPVRFPPPPG